jgi:hypothetical protein
MEDERLRQLWEGLNKKRDAGHDLIDITLGMMNAFSILSHKYKITKTSFLSL